MNNSEKEFFEKWKQELYENKAISFSLMINSFYVRIRKKSTLEKNKKKVILNSLSDLDDIKSRLAKFHIDDPSALIHIEKGFSFLTRELMLAGGILDSDPSEDSDDVRLNKPGRPTYPKALSKHIVALLSKQFSYEFKWQLVDYFKPGGEFDSWLQKKTNKAYESPKANSFQIKGDAAFDIKWLEGIRDGQKKRLEKL